MVLSELAGTQHSPFKKRLKLKCPETTPRPETPRLYLMSQNLQLKIEVTMVSVFVHSSKEAGAIALGLGGPYLRAS